MHAEALSSPTQALSAAVYNDNIMVFCRFDDWAKSPMASAGHVTIQQFLHSDLSFY